MLKIYYGSETIDKERFLFERIKELGGRTLLIVPDQFSAQTERNAFFYLEQKSFFDLQILDFDRLGHKAVQQAGVPVPPLIDKYGRHMLLAGLLRQEEHAAHLVTYKGMSGKRTFVSMMNSLISEMKRNEVTPQHLEGVLDSLDDRKYLKRKLQDIKYLFEAYEKAIEGKYLDSEDYITFYGDAILQSPLVKGSQVWIYGFDTFTPKNLLVIARLIRTADCVHIIMDYEDDGQEKDPRDAAFLAEEDRQTLFRLTGYVISLLEKTAEEAGHAVTRERIPGPSKASIWSMEDGGRSRITLAEASNAYCEAECAAAYITELVRDEGYHCGDIAVICNDQKGLGGILKRTLDQWGIPSFMDKKRTVLHHPAVAFVLSLMDMAAGGIQTEHVLSLLKSGLMDASRSDEEELENYAYQYKIRGTGWKRAFTRGEDKLGEDRLATCEKLRQQIVETVDGVRDSMGRRNTAGDKIRGLYAFLSDVIRIQDRLERIMDSQEAAGFAEAAAETAQSWNVICSIFDQVIEVAGERRISNEELKQLVTDGLEEMEIGLVPVHRDSVLIGTLQRTRLSRNKVLLVTGANEGILPFTGNEEGILSEQELQELEGLDLTVAKTDVVMRGEESLAIYRNLTAPEERLYMSCSKTDLTGEDKAPSRIFQTLRNYVAEGEGESDVRGDLGSEASGGILSAVQSPAGTLGHLADAVRRYRDGEPIDPVWLQVLRWYLEKDPDRFEKLEAGMQFTGKLERLGNEFAQALYMGDRDALMVSASRLEKYSSCPFAHFMQYGIRPEELIPYEIGARETGDIYHAALMQFSQALMPEEGIPMNDPASPWMSVSEDHCRQMVEEIVRKEMTGYMEGTIEAGGLEDYRTDRIIKICSEVAISLVHQVQKGRILAMDFEKPFDQGEELPPLEIKVGEKTFLLKGIIDRMDRLDAGGGRQAVRIVDYKTGNDEIRKEYYESGYKLQLMVYLNAALAKDQTAAPAGVFHFSIGEMDEDDKDGKVSSQDPAVRRDRNYRLKGLVLNEEDVILAMDETFEEESDVIPVKRNKEQEYKAAARGKLLSREEFEELRSTVEQQVERICKEIAEGEIRVEPRRVSKNTNACQYCSYKSICLFDTRFEGCQYSNV